MQGTEWGEEKGTCLGKHWNLLMGSIKKPCDCHSCTFKVEEQITITPKVKNYLASDALVSVPGISPTDIRSYEQTNKYQGIQWRNVYKGKTPTKLLNGYDSCMR